MTDLDLLVPAGGLEASVGAALRLGYTATSTDYDGSEHHYPPLMSPCRTFALELHTRLFPQVRQPFGLAPMIAEKDVCTIDGARLSRPSIRYRVLHALVHVGLSHAGFRRRRLLLRDLLDMSQLQQVAGERIDPAELLGLLEDAGARRGARGVLAAWGELFGEDVSALNLGWRDRLWARLAIAGLEGRAWRNVLMLPFDARLYLDSRDRWRFVRRAILEPRETFDWLVRRQRRENGLGRGHASPPAP